MKLEVEFKHNCPSTSLALNVKLLRPRITLLGWRNSFQTQISILRQCVILEFLNTGLSTIHYASSNKNGSKLKITLVLINNFIRAYAEEPATPNKKETCQKCICN